MEAIDFLKEAQRMCGEHHCVECPIGKYINHSEDKLEEIVSAVEKWSKEHPIVTNEMKFCEIFGENAANSILALHLSDVKRWLAQPYEERTK